MFQEEFCSSQGEFVLDKSPAYLGTTLVKIDFQLHGVASTPIRKVINVKPIRRQVGVQLPTMASVSHKLDKHKRCEKSLVSERIKKSLGRLEKYRMLQSKQKFHSYEHEMAHFTQIISSMAIRGHGSNQALKESNDFCEDLTPSLAKRIDSTSTMSDSRRVVDGMTDVSDE